VVEPSVDRMLDIAIAEALGHYVRSRDLSARMFDQFEWTMYPPGTHWLQTCRNGWEPLRPYSSDLNAAWEAVQWCADPRRPYHGEWPLGTRFMAWWRRADLWAYQPAQAAAAICRAILDVLAADRARPGQGVIHE
jgi:hypothetical protein